jgi:release factor glutamine methyltransferase
MAATLLERIADARDSLVQAGVTPEAAAIDAEVLARHILGWDRAALLTRGIEPASDAFTAQLQAAVRRRALREPVAFIIGHREFWGLDFEVTRDVLIPRPETELIIEAALELLPRDRAARIVDVGTGSGCLAVTLAVERPLARVLAIDISTNALAVARRNATAHRVNERIDFVRADLLTAVGGTIDLVVSNPPYVPRASSLPRDVASYEPEAALYAGRDGLDMLRRIIPDARVALAGGGAFVVEFGFGQADSVLALAAAAGWKQVEIREDLQEIPRVAVMR